MSGLRFTVEAAGSDTRARAGRLELAHGTVETPVFMPVGTAASVKAMLHARVSDLGYRLILGNTYHLYLRPGSKIVHGFGGLHGFSGWSHNILTDSGGFQVFSLSQLRSITNEGVEFRSHLDGSRHEFTPEGVVDIQAELGSDVQMQLDVCTGPEADRSAALLALQQTSLWAKRAKEHWRLRRDSGYAGALFGIVQGNFFPDLRSRSAEEIGELDLPGIAIGGLSVGESPAAFAEMLSHTAPLLPAEKPHYLMGVGTPNYIFQAVHEGIDMFDCVLPTRIARNGTVMTRDGRVVLKNRVHERENSPIDPECSCTACRSYSRGYLRHLFKSDEILGPMLATDHNLTFMADLMDGIRTSIRENRFLSFYRATMERYEEGERERASSRF